MSHYAQLVVELTILALAIFLGVEVISKVPTLLHTPLMSGTNAIHGIVIVGALLVAGIASPDLLTGWVGFIAMILAAANVVGGFVVTDRMLEMFKRREPPRRENEGRVQRDPMGQTTSNLLYLITIICFVLALRFLSSPSTARRGNWIGAAGMVVAIGVTLAHSGVHIGWRILVGGAIGAALGRRRRAPGEDDRDAADGGAVQRRRRRGGGPRVARGVPPARAGDGAAARRRRRSRSCSPA